MQVFKKIMNKNKQLELKALIDDTLVNIVIHIKDKVYVLYENGQGNLIIWQDEIDMNTEYMTVSPINGNAIMLT